MIHREGVNLVQESWPKNGPPYNLEANLLANYATQRIVLWRPGVEQVKHV